MRASSPSEELKHALMRRAMASLTLYWKVESDKNGMTKLYRMGHIRSNGMLDRINAAFEKMQAEMHEVLQM